jgi:uncharacterized membrane protein
MAILVLGLVIFLGSHSIRLIAPQWRARQVARLGLKWRGIHSLVSILGFGLVAWGFGEARLDAVPLWSPPHWLRYANALFTLVAFILITAPYIPRNHFKSKVGHPMYASVKVWSFGHLLATGMLHDLVLFGPFFVWSLAGFAISRRRDRQAGVTYGEGSATGSALTMLVGTAAWVVFTVWLHPRWIGVPAIS